MIHVTSETPIAEKSELEKEVDADLDSFSQAFQALGNDPLSRPERAIVKTYLAWKLGLSAA